MSSRSLVLGLVLLAGMCASSTATADCPRGSERVGTPVLRVVNGRRVYVVPDTCIPGEPQRPYNFAVTGRRAPEYARDDTPPHTVVEVVRAVRHAPF